MVKNLKRIEKEKRHPGRVARPHIMQDELEMISFAHA
jgi:hypothetical protein